MYISSKSFLIFQLFRSQYCQQPKFSECRIIQDFFLLFGRGTKAKRRKEAVVIQKHFRSYRVRRQVKADTSKLQIRRLLIELARKDCAVICLQQFWRHHIFLRNQKRKKENAAIICIENFIYAYIQRNLFQRLIVEKKAALVIRAFARVHITEKLKLLRQAEKASINNAAIKIQVIMYYVLKFNIYTPRLSQYCFSDNI